MRPDRLRQEGGEVVVYRPKPPAANQQTLRPTARPQSGTPEAVRAPSAPAAQVRTEPARLSSPQTYRAPAFASNPGSNPALQRPAPNSVGPQYRQETPKPVTSVAPRSETAPAARSAPSATFAPRFQSAMPQPNRPAPSFAATSQPHCCLGQWSCSPRSPSWWGRMPRKSWWPACLFGRQAWSPCWLTCWKSEVNTWFGLNGLYDASGTISGIELGIVINPACTFSGKRIGQAKQTRGRGIPGMGLPARK